MTAKAYYWNDGPRNFGDLLTPYILDHFANTPVMWAPPAEADIVCAGSVIDVLPDGWDGIVAGAGKLHEGVTPNLSKASVLGVRGYRTLGSFLNPAATIGDPGLLASELVSADRSKYDLGIVPHWTDTTLWNRYKYLNGAVLVDIAEDPLDVIKKIGSCERIVSSSLHGIIVADSFGLVRKAERFEKMSSPHEGGDFKFRDYASSIGQDIEFGKHGGQKAPREAIERIQAQLFVMLQNLEGLI